MYTLLGELFARCMATQHLLVLFRCTCIIHLMNPCMLKLLRVKFSLTFTLISANSGILGVLYLSCCVLRVCLAACGLACSYTLCFYLMKYVQHTFLKKKIYPNLP